jgi:hypothetical protein
MRILPFQIADFAAGFALAQSLANGEKRGNGRVAWPSLRATLAADRLTSN